MVSFLAQVALAAQTRDNSLKKAAGDLPEIPCHLGCLNSSRGWEDAEAVQKELQTLGGLGARLCYEVTQAGVCHIPHRVPVCHTAAVIAAPAVFLYLSKLRPAHTSHSCANFV